VVSFLIRRVKELIAKNSISFFADRKYNTGKFFAAFKDKASNENEQTEIGISFPAGKLIFKQIAGVLARRIVCRLKDGQSVKAGETFGLIHFGSRAELFLPENVEILVEPGACVKGGVTAIGRIK